MIIEKINANIGSKLNIIAVSEALNIFWAQTIINIAIVLAKIPFIIVCGKKEVADNTVTVRKLGSDKQEIMKRDVLIKNMLSSNKLPLN